MMMEVISRYVESLSAFWVGLAGGGLFKLILICCLISWICGGRIRWRCHRHWGRCRHCGCRCGYCPCGAGEDGDDEDRHDKGEETEEAV